MNQTEYTDTHAKQAREELVMTAFGVVFILALTVGTVFSFEARNARMLNVVEAETNVAETQITTESTDS